MTSLAKSGDYFLRKISESKYIYFFVFFAFLLVRAGFSFFSGFDNYELQQDSGRYIILSERVLNGNFNFDIIIFIVAPFYPLFVALHKFLFQDSWPLVLVWSQIIISSLSGVYFYKIVNLLFRDFRVSVISAFVYCLFPPTLYWVHTFAQEIVFQSFFIFFIYVFLNALYKDSLSNLILSAILYSIAFLTKSHILLYSPFIVLVIFYHYKKLAKTIYYSSIFGAVCFLFTLPMGIYNYKIHNTYTFSGNGAQFHFYMGNTQYAYDWIVKTPPYGSKDYWHLNMFEGAFGEGSRHDSITKLPHQVKQNLYFKESVKWIKSNPEKYFELKLVNLYKFLQPGVSFSHYPFKTALLMFLLSFPIYLFAYIGMGISFRENMQLHFWVLGLFIVMLIFSVVFYVQNRFRTITIEPFYIMYSVYGFFKLLDFFKSKKTIVNT